MDRVYISWSIENWITVVLMVALGYFLVSFIASLVRKQLGVFGGSNAGNQGQGFSVVPAQPLTGSIPGISGVAA